MTSAAGAGGRRSAAALAVVVLAFAAVDAAAQRLEVRSLGLEDGLASDHINDLVQDEVGRLWFATGNGVAVYDGRSVKNYGVADGLAWSDQALVGWHAGQLFAAARQTPYPVFLFDGEAFAPLPLPSLPLDMADGPSGLVVGVPGLTAALATDRGILVTDGNAWRLVGPEDGLPSPRVRSIAKWRGQLAAATATGLALLDHGEVTVGFERRLMGAPSVDLVALCPDGDSLWIIGRDWLGVLRERDMTVLSQGLDLGLTSSGGGAPSAETGPVSQGVRRPLRTVAAPDGQGGLYIVSGGALRHFDRRRNRLEVLDARRGVDVGWVQTVLLDREGAVWVGGDRGLVQILDRRFASFTTQDGLYDSAVVAVHRQPDGHLVLGHRGGLSFIDEDTVDGLALALTSPDGRRLEQVRDIADAPDGGLWLAADTRGLGRWSSDGSLRWYGSADGLRDAVTAVLNGADGELWVGTERGVVVRRNGRFQTPPGAPAFHTRGLAQGLDGALLVATDDGLHRYTAAEGWSAWRCGRGACDSTFGVLPDALGHWVATAAGLFRAPLTGSRLVPSHLPEVSEPIFFIVRDGGRLWLGTEDGVLGITPGGGRSERLSVEQGLSGRETYRAGALVDDDGRLWVGTERGLSRYDSLFERPSPPPPLVKLTSVDVDGISHPLDTPLELPADVREATFRFRAVTLSGPYRLRFRSWLEGVDESWLPPYDSESQEIRIAGLIPGTYRFHLQASLGGGEWSPPVVSESIVIRSPFWRRPWFLGVISALVLASFYLVPSLWVQRRQARVLESEVRRRTAELQASEDRYRKTFRTIEDGVLTTDDDGRVALLNPRAEELTGYLAADAVGRPVNDVLRLFQTGVSDKTGPPLPLLSASLQDTIGPTHTAVLEHRSGSRRPVELTAAPILSSSGFAGLVFAFRDVSRKKMVEAELARAQKLEAVGILAGGIAHDFNNLLTVLLGNVSLLQEGGRIDDDETQLLGDAETALMRARDLTHQLLTFSRGGAPVREAASISEVIHDSASFVLSGSKVRGEIDLAPDLLVVEIDAGQISQVLNNLLINASQAMHRGGTVNIVGRNVTDAPRPLSRGRYVRIDIVDTGTGIPEHLLPRIFDPYFSTKEEGRGLGLASAYSIIKNHEGLLTVDSEEGRGTTFHIFLPASVDGKVLERRGSSSNFRGQGRVLIMDDDAVVRRTSGAMLERLGFEVVFAEDGERAIELYGAGGEARVFDLVMMDLTVPGGMGGQEAMRRLLEIDPDVRAIVYSGYSNDPVLANYRDYGFIGRLTKPFRLTELRQLLETLESGADDA
ncbi:MAG: ATP-binding protein [Acidobacteriota bacterium]